MSSAEARSAHTREISKESFIATTLRIHRDKNPTYSRKRKSRCIATTAAVFLYKSKAHSRPRELGAMAVVPTLVSQLTLSPTHIREVIDPDASPYLTWLKTCVPIDDPTFAQAMQCAGGEEKATARPAFQKPSPGHLSFKGINSSLVRELLVCTL